MDTTSSDSNRPSDEWRSRFTPALAEQYRDDGVLFMPGLLHREWLDLIELGIGRIMNNSSRKNRFYVGDPGEFFDTVRNFDLTPEFQYLMYLSPLADMAAALLGSPKIWLLFDHVFVKAGGECRRTPWHQDLPYWPIAGEQIVSFWITLDPVPASECLEYIPGTHRRPMYDGFDPTKVLERQNAPFYGEGFEPLPDIEAERERWDIRSWDITPGDVVVFHPGVLHGGGPTHQGRSRRTLAVRCFGEDIVYAERPGTRTTAPRTPGLGLALSPGDPLRHPYYPRLRPLPPSWSPEAYC
jgi:ectoine hydroxylase-related dioxygenase (phytanoyl-CoA dioxygenase family)